VFRLPDDLRNLYLAGGLDLAKRNGDDSWELLIPATYLIASSGLIRLAFVEADFTRRFEPQAIVDLLAVRSGPLQ